MTEETLSGSPTPTPELTEAIMPDDLTEAMLMANNLKQLETAQALHVSAEHYRWLAAHVTPERPPAGAIAWLLETTPEQVSGPFYVAAGYGVTVTRDHNKAMRFATREAAELHMKSGLCWDDLPASILRPVEHAWTMEIVRPAGRRPLP